MTEDYEIGYIEITPIIPPNSQISVSPLQTLQYRFGAFLSTSSAAISIGEPHAEYLLKSKAKFYKIMLSTSSKLSITITSDSETAEG